MSELDQQAAEVLRHYPRIYVACHVDHRDRRGQKSAITARDQTILAHIPSDGVRARSLAQHLGVAASTLSAAIKRLADLKLILIENDPADGRGRIVRLSARGRAALVTTSVLDIARVRAALRRVSAAERDTIIKGLALLADAAQTRGDGA